MLDKGKIRWGWLKAAYLLTIVVAGGYGLAMILAPEASQRFFNAACEPVTYGISASVYVAFGLMSVLGVRDPLKYVPVLMLQLAYKSVWFLGVIFPLIIKGKLPSDAILPIVIFAAMIVIDLIAIPFPYVFRRQPAMQKTS